MISLPPSQLRLKLLPSLEKVFPGTPPQSCLESNRFDMLCNDSLSFQVGLYADSLMPCAANVSLVGPLAERATLRAVQNVVSNLTSLLLHDEDYLMTGPGIVPDLLEPLVENRITLAPRQWASLWVEVEIPAGFAPGVYPLTFHFDIPASRWGGGEAVHRELAVEIEVLPGDLPEQQLLCTHWFYTDCLADYYDVEPFSEPHWAIVEQQMVSAVRMGNNMLLTPVFTPPLNTEPGRERITTQLVEIREEGGTYSFGFDQLRRWVDTAHRTGFTHFEISHLFTQWGARFTPKILVNGETRFGWHVAADSPEYAAFLGQFLPTLTGWLREQGIAERTVFHISDEPTADMTESYGKAVALVEPYLKGFPIIDALSDFAFYEKGLVKKPVPATDHIEPFLEADIPGLWTYYCVGQSRDVANRFMGMPSARNRVIGPQLYKFGIEGFLHWGFNYYNTSSSIGSVNPFLSTDAGKGFPSGDSFVVYPGKRGQVLESIRYMVFREAMLDLRAFQLLEELEGREAVLSLIEEEAGGLTFSRYPRSQSYLLRLRSKVNRAIARAIRE